MHVRFDRSRISTASAESIKTHVSCKVSDRLCQLTYNSTAYISRPEIDPSRLEGIPHKDRKMVATDVISEDQSSVI
jgi:hypothetical protein